MAYEPFSGSGSQLLACEQLGRLCYAVELEPMYVAVALERAALRGLAPRMVRPPRAMMPVTSVKRVVLYLLTCIGESSSR